MEKLFQLVTFLPQESLEDIKNALYDLGLGKVGKYDCCLTWYEIHSSWRPMEGANPYIGTVGEIEFAHEYKLEVRVEEKDLQKAINAIKSHHPYEEVSINIVPLLII